MEIDRVDQIPWIPVLEFRNVSKLALEITNMAAGLRYTNISNL